MSISANPKNIRALVFDLDGTILAPGAVLTERTKKAIGACRERGLHIIIATGRAIDSAEFFRSSLGAEGPMIYFNGAFVLDMPSGEIISSALLDCKAAEFCLELAKKKGLYFQVYIPAGGNASRIVCLTDEDRSEREDYFKHTGVLAELGDVKEALSRPGVPGCAKGMFLAEPEIHSSIRPELEKRLGESAYIVQTYRTYLEILNKKASKGQALDFSMKHRGLKREEVIAFGDEENDLPMLKAAGFSVAPANAKENIKSAADLVVGSNAEDGVAVFLEDFFNL